MRKEEFAQFSAYLSALAMSFDRQLEPEQIILYFEALKDEFGTVVEFKEAAAKLLKEWRYGYFPRPAHFIEAAQGDLELIAEQAYSAAKSAAIALGVYKNIEFEDKVIEATITTLFRDFKEFHDRVAYIDSDDRFVKRDFIETYKRIAKNGAWREVKLIGYLQSEFNEPVKISVPYVPPKLKLNEQPNERVLQYLKPRKIANG